MPGVLLSARSGLSWILLVFLAFTFVPQVQADEAPAWLADLLARDRITVVVTDSGLGGLAVVADAAEKVRQHAVFEAVDLVFVNALFREAGGYNSLPTREQKLEVFDSALRAMANRYQPDLILVACNTLSVLAPDTDFAREGGVPVVGIVDMGVEQIADRLLGEPAARNILFATATTVEEGDHRDGLLELGVGEGQLLAQACPQLSFYIEQGFDAMDTELLIDAYVDEALGRLGETDGPLTVSFNCTHFGYALESWRLAFESRGVAVEAYLDPNNRMVDFLLPESSWQRHPGATVAVRVVSMVPLSGAAIDSIGRFLHGVSPVTETALRNYELAPGLFEWAHYLEAAD